MRSDADSTVAIHAEGLGKSYRIGRGPRATTLAERLVNAVRHPFGTGTDEAFWALRDASFEIPRGQAVGIIGRNGAGKSTLLKLLSRITTPTTGWGELRGRVGSLIEVGTGFHPELTGRENVYLNGAILGMRKHEVARRFDEIVAFAGIEQFIDTPVKRYSSGMYMRLAFAVAAHLDAEILVIDEVLAVGDIEFQRKCLGKMGEVAGAGRTVLFVSHSLHAISTLTTRAMVLERGRIAFDGATSDALAFYRGLQSAGAESVHGYLAPADKSGVHLMRGKVVTSISDGLHRHLDPFALEFVLNVPEPVSQLCFSAHIMDETDRAVNHFWIYGDGPSFRNSTGTFTVRIDVPRYRLVLGRYTVTVWVTDRATHTIYEHLTNLCPFEITMDGLSRPDYEWSPDMMVYGEDYSWQVKRT
ncbi:MAG: polysaccharide ABC transporter ATP-binding protein [Gemmatimonadetes bacterium]|nr:polysaccharide ABC transporter ATP-binding protein [Gemmatimonadota bacterium]